jgi:uncharacterized coiled-coil protein SlyX
MDISNVQRKVEESIQLEIRIAEIELEMAELQASIEYINNVNAAFDKYLPKNQQTYSSVDN